MALDRDRVLALQRRGLRDWIAMLGQASEGARVFERDGVSAALVPASPQRSIPNSVSYTDPDALLGALDELERAYADAGIARWTVWVPEFEGETIAELEAAGHGFDGKPAAMALDLERVEPPELGDLDWDREGRPQDFGRINDLAYGLTGQGFSPALTRAPADRELRLYRARVDGEVASVAGTLDHGDDLGFYFVATLPRFRGRGLAGRLMAVALIEAAERGLRTSSLQASAMGEPVYRRLGYESPFRMHLYERRRR